MSKPVSNSFHLVYNPNRHSSVKKDENVKAPKPPKLNFAFNPNYNPSQVQAAQPTNLSQRSIAVQTASTPNNISTPTSPNVNPQSPGNSSPSTLQQDQQTIQPPPLNLQNIQQTIRINLQNQTNTRNVPNKTVEQIKEIRGFMNEALRILNIPYSSSDILNDFNNLNVETQKTLCHKVWYQDGGKNDPSFGDVNHGKNAIQADPKRLFAGKPSIMDLCLAEKTIEHIQPKVKEVVVRPQVIEIIKFVKEAKNLSNPQAVLEKFRTLSPETQKALCHKVWYQDGGKNDPFFGDVNHGEIAIQSNPKRLVEGNPSIAQLCFMDLYIAGIREDAFMNELLQQNEHLVQQIIASQPLQQIIASQPRE